MSWAAAARGRASFTLYLVALALLPFKWLSPFSHAQAGWTDAFLAAAVAAFALEVATGRAKLRLRAVHLLYGAFLGLVELSALQATPLASDPQQNVVIAAELAVLAVLTAEFARLPGGLRAIAHVILYVSLAAIAEGAIGLLLFYLGDTTSLVNGASAYLSSSSLYTRVAAGFYSPPLLGSFCVFASAVLAIDGAELPPRERRIAQIGLAVLVVTTVSRPAIAFAVGLAARAAARSGTRRARHLAVVGVGAAVVVLALLSLAPLSLDPIRQSASGPDINPRLEQIRTAGEAVWRRPFLGSGPGALTAIWDGGLYRAHMTPLNVAATVGLPALATLAGIIVLIWRRRRRPADVAIWSGLASLLLDGLTQDIDHFRHVWIMLGLADGDRAADT